MVYIIGVSGCSGSGKTTVSQELKILFGENDCLIISMDNYYRTKIDREARQITSFDDPAAIDFDLLVKDILALKEGRPIQMPDYDFTVSDRKDSVTEVAPKNIIIVEGIFALCREELNTLLELKVFVETDIAICKDRRISRDIRDRGRDQASAETQWEEEVKPSYDKFIKPSKNNADLIFANSGSQEDQQQSLHTLFNPIRLRKSLTSGNRYRFNAPSLPQEPSLSSSVEDHSLEDPSFGI